ncbi:class I SAM-dependent methyltransferase [Thalassobaculum sp.]|uniref:class I SAM-dependent methyltransferase n=1 Tax=Thalassobaculum sp. TaxID=2022740 RepID=UPI0032F07C21
MTTMQRSARFWDRIADRYARTPVADEATYRTKLRVTREYLRANMEVLELGCGTGSTALVHAPAVRRLLAVDVSARMLEIARRKADAAGAGNLEFRQAGIEDFEAPDASFDAVLAHSVLHLLEDRDAAIRKVHRLLRPGGLFVTSTPCLGDFLRIFRLVGPLGHALGLIPMVRVFTAAELEASLAAAGFRTEHRWQPGRRKALFIVARK